MDSLSRRHHLLLRAEREKSAPLREKKMPAADATRATAMRDSFKWDFARSLLFFSLSWSFLFLNLHVALHSSCCLCISFCFFVFKFARGLSFFSLSALCLGRGGHVVCSSVDPCFSTSGPSSVPPFHFFLLFVKTSVSFSFSLLLLLCSVFHQGTGCVCSYTCSQTL